MRIFRCIIRITLIAVCVIAASTLFCGYISPGDIRFFSLIALSYPITFISLITGIILLLMMRDYHHVIMYIMILLVILIGREMFGTDIINKQDGRLKFISYNVQAFNYYNKNGFYAYDISYWMMNENPDIVCLQEYAHLHEGTNIMTDIYKYHAEGFSDNNNTAQTGTMILSKYPIINHGKKNYEGVINNILWADIKINDDTIRVFNLHLYSTNAYQTMRKIDKSENNNSNAISKIKSISLLAKNITLHSILRSKQADDVSAMISLSKFPVIVCGDFNDVPFSYAYKKIKGEMNDSFSKAGFGYWSTFRYFGGLFRIDNIFSSEEFKIKTYKTYSSDWSDHLPVISTFDL